MAPKLYIFEASPPCTTVRMVAKRIGLNLELEDIKIENGEFLRSPEFLKMNPQHTLPTFVDDDGFTLWDSHAIIVYIISKYAKDKSLYPEDPKVRAVIDQRLHFDSGVIFPKLLKLMLPVYFGNKKDITQEDRDSFDEAYAFLELFLEGRQWFAGNTETVADLSILPNITAFNAIHKINPDKYPKLLAWLRRCDNLPEIDIERKSLEAYRGLWKQFGLKVENNAL